MTSSEIEIQRNKSKRDAQVKRSSQESSNAGQNETGLFNETAPHQSSAGKADRHDPMLKSMIDRDTKKSSRYGNAIEKQKNRALSSATSTASSKSNSTPKQSAKARSAAPQDVYVPQEYEYHTNRILIAVVIGLVVISLLGWGLFMMFRGEAPSETTNFTADPYAQSSEISEAATLSPAAETGTQVSENTVAANNDSMDSLRNEIDESKTQPLDGGATPASLNAPEQPAFNQESSSQSAGSTEVAQTSTAAEPAPSAQSSSEAATIPASIPTEGEGILVADKVARTNLARGVRSYEPVGVYETQDISLEGRNSFRLFWFTQLTNLNGQTVTHRWYYNDVLAADIPMNIGSDSWRTTSNKQVDTNTLGSWRVEAVDSAGQVLARQSFNIVE